MDRLGNEKEGRVKEHSKKVGNLIANNEDAPLPLAVIPNHMGINLCSVDSISWTEQDDGQLTRLTIHFSPSVVENPPPVDDYTLRLEILLTDLLSVLRAFTCRHCSGASCAQCEQTGYHPFARRAIKRIEETLRKEWVDGK